MADAKDISEILNMYAEVQQNRIGIASSLLTSSQLTEFKERIPMSYSEVDIFNPYRLLPSTNLSQNTTQKFLIGNPRPSSEMNKTEFQEALSIAKTRPWDIYQVSNLKSQSTMLEALETSLDCDQRNNERPNDFHFVPFSQNEVQDVQKLIPDEGRTILPMFMWIKGAEMMIYAIENRHVFLVEPGVIACSTNPTHAKFLEVWGFKNQNGIMTIEFGVFKDNFQKMMAGDRVTKRIIESGYRLFNKAVQIAPTYIQKYSMADNVPFFWKWYFSQK